MLFSLDITIDYIILDDNVLKIVNKNTEIGKKKMKGWKQNKSTIVIPGTQAHQCCPFSSAWGIFMKLLYFLAHKTHRDFFVRNFRKK